MSKWRCREADISASIDKFLGGKFRFCSALTSYKFARRKNYQNTKIPPEAVSAGTGPSAARKRPILDFYVSIHMLRSLGRPRSQKTIYEYGTIRRWAISNKAYLIHNWRIIKEFKTLFLLSIIVMRTNVI